MNQARTFYNQVTRAGVVAATPDCGYVVYSDGSRYVQPDPPHILKEARNKTGRCTFLSVRYSDGSVLQFRWSDALGPRFNVVDNRQQSAD